MAMSPCPNCGKLNRATARFCGVCGQTLTPIQSTTQPASPSTAPQPRPTFTPSPQQPSQTIRPSGNMTKAVSATSYVLVIVALLIGVCIVGVIIVTLLMQNGLIPNIALGATGTPTTLATPTVEPTVTAIAQTIVPTGASFITATPVPPTATGVSATSTPEPTTIATATPPAIVIAAPTPTTPSGTLAPLSSLRVSRQAAAGSGIRVNIRYADGSPAGGKYVRISTQKPDIGGNPVIGDRVEDNRTDNAGTVLFNLKPGTYAVEVGDLVGYDYGSKFNYAVTDRNITVLDISLARIRIGLKDADGKPLGGKYVAVSLQKTDVSGNPVRGDRVNYDRTDNTGLFTFDLTAGYYLVDIGDIAGYPWGDPFNRAARPGETTQIIVSLGRIRVGLKDAEGKPLGGKYVAVHFQKKDVDGNPIIGDRIGYDRTDNTGIMNFDLTPGIYDVEIGDLAGVKWGEPLNRVVQASNTTSVVVSLGRVTIGLKGADGKPITGRYVALYLQKKDVAGNVTKGDRIVYDRTDNAGLLSWDVTAGNYILEIENITTQQNIVVQPGKTTTSDGRTTSTR